MRGAYRLYFRALSTIQVTSYISAVELGTPGEIYGDSLAGNTQTIEMERREMAVRWPGSGTESRHPAKSGAAKRAGLQTQDEMERLDTGEDQGA